MWNIIKNETNSNGKIDNIFLFQQW